MLKKFSWAACKMLLAVACFTPTSNGVAQPWASNTDPTDVPKIRIQDVTTAPFTYRITQGGTIDGRMCTTLPGVWEPYEQTWESNRSVRMENVGGANVINPWLKIGPIDFFSQQTIAHSVVEGLSTNREKALAIFYFYITHRYHKGNAQYYTWEGDTTVQLDGWAWWTMGMVLRPHEAIQWRWGHATPVKYHGDMTGYPPTVPDTIYNGLWGYAPDLKNDSQWREGATVTNITNKDGVLTAVDGGPGPDSGRSSACSFR